MSNFRPNEEGGGQGSRSVDNSGMFKTDFNLQHQSQQNSVSLKSVASLGKLAEKWSTLMNVEQLQQSFGTRNGQFLAEQWMAHNANSISSNAGGGFGNGTHNSFSSILESLQTLSVRNNNNPGFPTLPSDWFTQAPAANGQAVSNSGTTPRIQIPPQPSTIHHKQFPQRSPTGAAVLHQDSSSPYPGDKRNMENSSFANVQQQQKLQRLGSMDMTSPLKQEYQDVAKPNVLTTPAALLTADKAKVSPVASSNSSGNTRWNSWSHEEEVFLVVAVLDRFFRRGSLASSGKGANAQNVDCWAEIKRLYDKICKTWAEQPANRVKPPLIARSTSALCRHFKIMKVRAVEGDKDGTHNGNFRKYLREWDTKFNVNGKLIPDEY